MFKIHENEYKCRTHDQLVDLENFYPYWYCDNHADVIPIFFAGHQEVLYLSRRDIPHVVAGIQQAVVVAKLESVNVNMNQKTSTITLLLLLIAKAALVEGYSAAFALNRRCFLASGVSAASAGALLPPPQANAAASPSVSKLVPFEDPKNGFSIQVPVDWVDSVRTLPDRRTIRFWADPKDPTTFVFIAYTPVRDDFTSLGSFGSVEVVADQTIMPKGELAGVSDVDAKMLSAKSERQAYVFDYQQSVPNVQPMTHFRTIFTLQQGATGGAGAVLVTITAQTPEERYQSDLQPVFDDIVASYAPMKMKA